MGALVYNFGNDCLFKNSVGTGQLMFCDVLDDFAASSTNVSVVTDIGINVQETVQFFQSFDDFIHYYYFGKGLGTITVNFLFFQECGSGVSAPGLNKLMQTIGGIRGKPTDFSIGNITFTGVLRDFTITVISDPETYYAVSMNLGMINHTLQTPEMEGGAC